MVLPPAALAAKLDRKYPGITVSPDPTGQSLLIGTGQNGPVQIQGNAIGHGHTIDLVPAAITGFGWPLPPNERIRDKLTFHRTLNRLPLALAPQSLSVTASGLQLILAGGPAGIDDKAAGEMHQGTSPAADVLRRR